MKFSALRSAATFAAFSVVIGGLSLETMQIGDGSAARLQLAAEVTALADEYVRVYANTYPEAAGRSGLPVADPGALTDNSLSGLARWHTHEDRWKQRLAGIDSEALRNQPEWITLGFLREAVEASVDRRVCRHELWPVNHLMGWPVRFGALAEAQPIQSTEDRTQVLSRWRLVPQYLDTEIANLRAGLRAGYSTPRASVDLVIGQIEQLLDGGEEVSPLFSPARRSSDSDFKAEWKAYLASQLRPAMGRYLQFLREEYRDKARETLAITAHPGGAECYEASFRYYTSLQRSATETIKIGEAAVAANRRAISEIGRKAFGVSDFAEVMKRVQNEPSERFDSREMLLAFSRAAVERARSEAIKWFLRLPAAAVVVEPYPEFREASRPPDSYSPAVAGKPATYRILLRTDDRRRGSTEVTAFHESYPGHHLQIGLAQEQPSGHPIRLVVQNTGFTEGWGRYAERLAEEMGLYSSVHALIHRRAWPARPLLFDPGLHVLGWSDVRAEQVMTEIGRSKEAARAQMIRIAVWPAQNTAYDTGGLELVSLREQAQRELGGTFAIREFHHVVLRNGAITLAMLREEVERWISEKKDRNAA